MRVLLILLLLVCAVSVTYDYTAGMVQEVIVSNGDQSWAPMAQNLFAATSYYLYQNRIAREAYAMQIKMFPNESDRARALYRIARASERLSDYSTAAKYYQLYLTEFPKHKKAPRVKGRLADVEGVYLEFDQ